MLEGIDWANDRDWIRAIYLRMPWEVAKKLQKLSYPHFRTPKIIVTFSSDDD